MEEVCPSIILDINETIFAVTNLYSFLFQPDRDFYGHDTTQQIIRHRHDDLPVFDLKRQARNKPSIRNVPHVEKQQPSQIRKAAAVTSYKSTSVLRTDTENHMADAPPVCVTNVSGLNVCNL